VPIRSAKALDLTGPEIARLNEIPQQTAGAMGGPSRKCEMISRAWIRPTVLCSGANEFRMRRSKEVGAVCLLAFLLDERLPDLVYRPFSIRSDDPHLRSV
jgi:hypothetical protein